MTEKPKLVLVLGATGKSGFHITNTLINSGYAVRIVVRSKNKVAELFQEKEISFESIIEGSLEDITTLEKAFQPSDFYGKVSIVVSALGARVRSNEDEVEEIEYLTQKRLIKQSVEKNVSKYILVSGALIERPWNLIAVALNYFFSNVYHWKVQAENHLRLSGLKYAIVRPTELIGDEKDITETEFKIDQGDKVNGKITRFTLSKVVLDTIESQNIPEKVTFECTGSKEKGKNLFEDLKGDDLSSILHVNHRSPKKVYGITFFLATTLGAFLLYKNQLSKVSIPK